jgi:hypothetical protein
MVLNTFPTTILFSFKEIFLWKKRWIGEMVVIKTRSPDQGRGREYRLRQGSEKRVWSKARARVGKRRERKRD